MPPPSPTASVSQLQSTLYDTDVSFEPEGERQLEKAAFSALNLVPFASRAGMKRNESLWSLIGMDTDTGADVLSFPFYDKRLPSLENFFANPYVWPFPPGIIHVTCM